MPSPRILPRGASFLLGGASVAAAGLALALLADPGFLSLGGGAPKVRIDAAPVAVTRGDAGGAGPLLGEAR